jgi:hypothetical protein
MIRSSVALLALLLVACTQGPSGTRPSPTGSSPATPPDAVELAVVAGPGAEPYLRGMEVAVRQINRSGGIDGVPVRLRRSGNVGVSGGSPATLVVGSADAVTRLRPEIESSGAVVVVIGDDPYSSRELFRSVFQASVPELWQARKLARLLVTDLRFGRIALVSGDRDTIEAYEAGFAEEGTGLSIVEPGGDTEPACRVAGSDAVLLPGPADEIGPLATAIDALPEPPLLALGSEGLGVDAPLPPGTLAPYHYAWSGWADPIARVHRFRTRFRRIHGLDPEGLEQEGYDAVRVLAEVLRRTDGGGDALIRELEAVADATFSALPLRLGPDDHVLLPEGQLGVFAVARPGTEAPGEALATNPWRPVMRTFTYNGERVTIARRDLRVFFPSWRHPAPSPEFQVSRYGITSPAGTPPR